MAPPLHKVIKTPEQFANMVMDFIAECKASGKTPYKQRFCLDNGINKEQLSRWKNKYSEVTEHDPQLLICQAIKSMELASEVQQLDRLDSNSSCSNAMFLLKAQHGYIEQEKVKHEVTGGISIEIATGVPKG